MNPVINAVLVLGAIGAVCALILVLASKFMHVPEDDRFPKIRECLPGANCGACGYAGCDGYAAALVEGSEQKTNLCIPGAAETAASIAQVLGVEPEHVVEMRAYVRCNGNCEQAKRKYVYEGVSNCSAANILFQGEWACPSSCHGHGDCEKACPSDAIHVENGVARVQAWKCTGCGLCTRTCPNNLIYLRRVTDRVIVRCGNTQRGALTRQACENGCLGCKRCERACPTGAIKVTDNLAHIDHDKCSNCGACMETCPVGVIEWI